MHNDTKKITVLISILLIVLGLCIVAFLAVMIGSTVESVEPEIPEIVFSQEKTVISRGDYGIIVPHLKYKNGSIETADFRFEVEEGKQNIEGERIETNGLYHVVPSAPAFDVVLVTVSCPGNDKIKPVQVKIFVI